jgi:hypothetical protein
VKIEPIYRQVNINDCEVLFLIPSALDDIS